MRRRPRSQEHLGSAIEIAAGLRAITDQADRQAARVGRREQVAQARLHARELQARVRLADSFAKLGGGSLLTASLLLMINGQVTGPVMITAVLALLVFVASTIFVPRLDRQVAQLDHEIDIIEAALKETER